MSAASSSSSMGFPAWRGILHVCCSEQNKKSYSALTSPFPSNLSILGPPLSLLAPCCSRARPGRAVGVLLQLHRHALPAEPGGQQWREAATGGVPGVALQGLGCALPR